jgi:hypothetical protein
LAYPLVEELKPRPEGNYFLRFSERIRRERSEFEVDYSFPVESWRFAQQELLCRLSHLPQSLAALRVQMVLDHIISGLAGIEAKLSNGAWPPETRIAIETLIDFVAAGVNSPVAPEIAATLAARPTPLVTKNGVPSIKKTKQRKI